MSKGRSVLRIWFTTRITARRIRIVSLRIFITSFRAERARPLGIKTACWRARLRIGSVRGDPNFRAVREARAPQRLGEESGKGGRIGVSNLLSPLTYVRGYKRISGCGGCSDSTAAHVPPSVIIRASFLRNSKREQSNCPDLRLHLKMRVVKRIRRE